MLSWTLHPIWRPFAELDAIFWCVAFEEEEGNHVVRVNLLFSSMNLDQSASLNVSTFLCRDRGNFQKDFVEYVPMLLSVSLAYNVHRVF